MTNSKNFSKRILKTAGCLFLVISIVGFVASLRIFPLQDLGVKVPWITFYPAVMLIAIFYGFGFGLVATLLTLAIVYFWSPIEGQVFLKEFGDWLGAGIFFINCTVISLVSEGLIKAKQKIKQAEEIAKKASFAKSNFLATMSHEIRTPINAIIGTSYLLGLTKLEESQRQDLSTIEIASKNLLALINDILDFSKIESGELTIQRQEFSLAELLNDLKIMFSVIAEEKDIQLHVVSLKNDFPAVLIGDSNRLRQMLVNLISNAIKFTNKGCVDLDVTLVQKANNLVTLRFSIMDTGVGISEENQTKLFQPFIQIQNNPAREFGGSGLGLSIVKRLAEMLDGTVGIESQIGVGSTFWLEIPYEIATSDYKEHIVSEQNVTAPLRVIIVDDHSQDIATVIKICVEFNWNVERVENAKGLIDKVSFLLKNEQHIDCIIANWHISILNVMKTIKEELDNTIPSVVMVAAHEKVALKAAIIESCAHEILEKPIFHATLFNAVNKAVLTTGCELNYVFDLTVVKAKRSQWLKDVKLLIVDDNIVNLDVVSRVLEKQGALITVSDSGEKCLAILREKQDYDAVLMDLHMPKMDGCETTIQIRQNLKLSAIPIIALTAGATTNEQERAVGAGIDDFLIKPAPPIAVIKTLRKYVEKYRNAPIDVGTIGVEKTEFKIDELIDMNKLLEYFEDDLDFFKTSLRKFIDEHTTMKSLDKIKEWISKNEMTEAVELVHKIKGSAGILCLKALHQSGMTLENVLSNSSIENYTTPLEKFEHEYNKVLSISAEDLEQLSLYAVTPATSVLDVFYQMPRSF